MAADIPNVTTPVIINATTSLLIKSDFFLRRVCFVSCGESKLKNGELITVEASTYTQYVNSTTSELYYRLRQFFAYANNKLAYIFECGAQPTTPLNDTFVNLQNYCETVDANYQKAWKLAIYEADYTDTFADCYQWAKRAIQLEDGAYSQMAPKTVVAPAVNTPTEFPFQTSITSQTFKVYNDANRTTELINKLHFDFTANTYTVTEEVTAKLYVYFADGQNPVNSNPLIICPETDQEQSVGWAYAGAQQGYITWLIANNKNADLTTLGEYLAISDPNWKTLRAVEIVDGTPDLKAKLNKAGLEAFATANATYMYPTGYEKYLVDNGIVSQDYTAKMAMVKTQIDNGVTRIYIYALPAAVYYWDGLGAFCQGYASTDSAVYFAVDVDTTEVLTESQNYGRLKNLKSVIPIYNNGSKGYALTGAILGRFASSMFDLSDTNQATPINYKTINGFNFEFLQRRKERELIAASVSFASELVGNTVILNGRMADSRPIDYWYQWDLIAFNIQEAIVTVLLQGVNNPARIVKFDQNGIDTLNAAIKSRLVRMQNYGALTEFCISIDPATNEVVGSGYINAISFATYAAVNPDKYAMETYDGFSFYIRIGKYIRQVILNITLG